MRLRGPEASGVKRTEPLGSACVEALRPVRRDEERFACYGAARAVTLHSVPHCSFSHLPWAAVTGADVQAVSIFPMHARRQARSAQSQSATQEKYPEQTLFMPLNVVLHARSTQAEQARLFPPVAGGFLQMREGS